MTDCPPPPHPQAASLKILFADDDPVLRTAVRGLLRLKGYRADVVSNGREALAAALVRDYDFVFLDIEMPEMNGYEAAIRIRESHREFPPWIVGISGDPEPERAFAVGMDEFLVKPLLIDQLIQILEHAPEPVATP